MKLTNPLYTQQLMDKHGIAWFKFDETSGNVTDSKGSAVGTVTGATRVEGVSGNALNFDGSSYVTFTSRIMPLGKKSIRFKIKKDSKPIANSVFYADSGGSGHHGSTISVNASDGSLVWQHNKSVSGTARFVIISTTNICDGKWHDILLTWDGTTSINGVKLYIDDMITPNATEQANATETTIQEYNSILGRYYNGSTYPAENYFTGQLDEFEIYNEVIDPVPKKILFLSRDKTYSILPKELAKHETKMTSNTAPSPLVASASSIHSASYPAWYAFNGVNGVSNCWASSTADTNTAWIQINFGKKIKVNTLILTSRGNDSYDYTKQTPKDFIVKGSEDGLEWIDLGTFSESNWNSYESREFGLKHAYCQYYRIQVISNNGSTNTSIGNILYSYKNNILEIPNSNEQNFITYGANKIDNFRAIQTRKDYVLQGTVSENEDGLWETKLNRKPLSISFN